MGRLARTAGGTALLAGGAALYLWLYRPWQTRWGASDDERRSAAGRATSSSLGPPGTPRGPSTVAATPEQVWPFLVQLGWGRGRLVRL